MNLYLFTLVLLHFQTESTRKTLLLHQVKIIFFNLEQLMFQWPALHLITQFMHIYMRFGFRLVTK